MRCKLNVLAFIFFSLLGTIVGINDVWAITIEDSYKNGTAGNISGCGGKNCYSGAVGFRISIVNQNGDRCYYDSNSGILCGSTGKLIEPKDFWFLKISSSDFYNSKQCYTFNEKRIKHEFSSYIKNKKISDLVTVDETNRWNPTISSSEIVNCNQKEVKTIYNLFGDSYKPSDWDSSDKLIEPTRNPKNMEKIIKWFNTEQDKGNEEVLNKVLKSLIGSDVSEISSGLESANIQFEQLLMVTNYDKNEPDSYVSFMGSVAEASYLYLNMPTPKAYFKTGASRACTIANQFTAYTYKVGTDTNHTACGSNMFSGGYWTGWWGDFKDNHLSKADKNSPTRNIGRYLNGKLTKNLDLSYFYKVSDTSNVFNVKISDKYINTCDKSARKIVKAHCQNEKNGKYEECDEQYISTLRSNEDTKNCVKNGKVTSECNALDPHNIKLYNGIKKGVDACKEISCDTLASDVFDKYKSISNQIGTKNSDYENYMGWLYNIHNNNMLITAFWRDVLEADRPSCSNTEYNCKPGFSGSISNCNANTTFSDTTNIDCLQNNIAYNDINNTSDYTAYETSKDSVFSSSDTDGCKVYCNESVIFKLPNENGTYGTKAGRIFKWGKDTDSSNSKFGSMTVRRECQIAKKANGGICDSDRINIAYWAQTVDKSSNPKYGIGTLITLNYREPVSGQEISSQLNTTLDENEVILTINNNQQKIEPDTIYNCHGKCSEKFFSNSFTVTATYSFNYGKGFHWYSNKENNNKIVSESSIDDDSDANYVELGYGLPTAFTSPNVSYSTYKDNNGYTWLTSASNTEGYMYATIKNIGTRKSDGTYHFDKLIKTQSNNKAEGFNVDGSLTYGCDYSIKNEMFGTECVGSDNDPDYCNPKTSPKGIDVVFRTVELMSNSSKEELDRAFPGMSGTGRIIGANWAQYTEEQISKILNSSVYSKEPMYQINLTVDKIQKIRIWNREARASSDPYSDMTSVGENDSNAGYTGYYYPTKDETDKYVKVQSSFITNLIKEGWFEKNSTCLTRDASCYQNTEVLD